MNRGATSIEKIDDMASRKEKQSLKREKIRRERRRAKRKPDCTPGYGKYQGYAT